MNNRNSTRRLIIFTGAGISAESGVPTFRTGPDGLWHNHRIEDVCNINTFEQNYDLVHEFYNARRTARRRRAQPCPPGHRRTAAEVWRPCSPDDHQCG